MPATEADTFVKPRLPQSSVTGSSEDGDDEDGPIATINAMTIRVGDDSDSPPRPSPSERSNGGVNPSLKPGSSSAKASSLRSLLSIPPMMGAASAGSSHPPAPSGGGLLGVPPSTSARTAPAGIGGASGARLGVRGNGSSNDEAAGMLPSEIAPKRKKVILGPGCSALDWARLKSAIPSQGFRKITPSELKMHKSTEDAWSAFNGKVYDLTPYLRFHPGGERELMRVAGRDGTRLFMLTHSWVNIDSMIDSCVVGVLVSESST